MQKYGEYKYLYSEPWVGRGLFADVPPSRAYIMGAIANGAGYAYWSMVAFVDVEIFVVLIYKHKVVLCQIAKGFQS